jgi:hypothetical protein
VMDKEMHIHHKFPYALTQVTSDTLWSRPACSFVQWPSGVCNGQMRSIFATNSEMMWLTLVILLDAPTSYKQPQCKAGTSPSL